MRISWDLTAMFLNWGHNTDYADISWFVMQCIQCILCILYISLLWQQWQLCVCLITFDILDLDQNKLLTFRGSAWPSLLLPPHDNFSTWGKYLSWPRSGDRVGAFLWKALKNTDWPQLWYVNSGGEQDIMGVGWKEVGGNKKSPLSVHEQRQVWGSMALIRTCTYM